MIRFYYTYMLKCADGSFYVGVTNNLDKRVAQHNAGNDPSSYTYDKRPVELVYHQMLNDPEAAIVFEKKLKGWSRGKKMALMNGDFDTLPGLAKKKFKT